MKKQNKSRTILTWIYTYIVLIPLVLLVLISNLFDILSRFVSSVTLSLIVICERLSDHIEGVYDPVWHESLKDILKKVWSNV